jgi:hypothetical protein
MIRKQTSGNLSAKQLSATRLGSRPPTRNTPRVRTELYIGPLLCDQQLYGPILELGNERIA